jgi:ATP-dependent DNA helicase DinG
MMKPADDEKTLLDSAAIIAGLEEGGAIAGRLEFFEPRRAQLDLMALIIRGFNEDALVAAEAGTGVGKSFAYLVPAVHFAAGNSERIIISTATITLQQQLFEKDLPLVLSALGDTAANVKTVLVKGRGNYLCHRRFFDLLTTAKQELLSDDLNVLEAIMAWAEHTTSGDRSELPFIPPETVWGKICSDTDSCMGPRCPRQKDCFVFALRREAAAAQIIVVNHHVLFADLAARNDDSEAIIVLPASARVILDEAHTIENAATSFFSEEFAMTGLQRELSRFYRKRGAQESGLLLRAASVLYLNVEAAENAVAQAAKIIAKIKTEAETLNAAALHLCGETSVFRLIPARRNIITERLLPPLTALHTQLLALSKMIRGITDDERFNEADEGLLYEIKAAHKRLLAVDAICAQFIGFPNEVSDPTASTARDAIPPPSNHEPGGNTLRVRDAIPPPAHYAPGRNTPWVSDTAVSTARDAIPLPSNHAPGENTLRVSDTVLWIERRSSRLSKTGDYAAFIATPLDVGAPLRKALFDCKKTVVCVSATLTVAQSFDYWMSRVGITREGRSAKPLLQGVFPSPFPYEKATLLACPADAPLPSAPAFRAFVDEAAAALAREAGGSALILFTSFESLRSAYEHAAPRLAELGIRCMKQGDEERSRLLRAFLEDERSVLFATDSFWEGVDAPGNTLRLVVMARLPFRIPNDPVFEARCEAIERSGANPFMALSVPEAVMKFRQGFGRLMRRSSDRGVVVCLDSRLLKKQYGALFLQSLPKTKTCFAGFETILRNTEAFLF